MRILPTRSVLAVLCAFASCAVVPALGAADDIDLPARKAGQWELKTVMDEGNGPKEQMLTMCIDADMEKNTVAASKADHKENCSKYEVKKDGDKIVVNATCKFNERNVESATEMSGDFATTFQVKIDSTTSGTDGNNQSISVKRAITQTGKYLGESCGDLKAGEAKGSDGKKVYVQ
jgi:hypothetical protein